MSESILFITRKERSALKFSMRKYMKLKQDNFRYGWDKAKRMKVCYLFLLPYAVLFFAFYILPILTSIYYSFTYYNILDPRSSSG